MQITKTEMYWIMFFFHLEKKIDLETSFSTPIPLLTPPWTETTFSWFGTGLRKVHNHREEETSACKTNPVPNLTDSSPIRKYLLQSKSFLDVTSLLWLWLFIQGQAHLSCDFSVMLSRTAARERFPQTRDFSWYSYVNRLARLRISHNAAFEGVWSAFSYQQGKNKSLYFSLGC